MSFSNLTLCDRMARLTAHSHYCGGGARARVLFVPLPVCSPHYRYNRCRRVQLLNSGLCDRALVNTRHFFFTVPNGNHILQIINKTMQEDLPVTTETTKVGTTSAATVDDSVAGTSRPCLDLVRYTGPRQRDGRGDDNDDCDDDDGGEETGTVTAEDLLEILESLKRVTEEQYGERDAYSVTPDRKALLLKFGSYLDRTSGRNVFKYGYDHLFTGNVTDVRRRWCVTLGERVAKLAPFIPVGVRWLVVHVSACYGARVDAVRRNKRSVIARMVESVVGMTRGDFNTSDFLSALTAFNAIVGECTCDGSTPVREFLTTWGGHPAVARTAAAPETVDHEPRDVERRRDQRKEKKRAVTGDTGSNTERGETRKKRRGCAQGTRADGAPTADSENAAGSVQRTEGGGGGGQRGRGVNVFDTSLVVVADTLPVVTAGRRLAVSALKPNRYVADAMRTFVIDTLDRSARDGGITLTFGYTVLSMVMNISAAVLGSACVDVERLKSARLETTTAGGAEDAQRSDAIAVCLGLLPLLDKNKSGDYNDAVVTVPWSVVRDWSVSFSRLLNTIVADTVARRLSERKRTLDDLSQEFFGVRQTVEQVLLTRHSALLPLFERLSEISDVCLYVLFGVNLTNGNTPYHADAVVKNVLLAWRTAGHFPIDLQDSDGEEVRNLFMCLPLAFLTKLRGAGTHRDDNANVCTVEEFLEAGLNIL